MSVEGAFSPIAPTVNIDSATTTTQTLSLGVPASDLGSKVVRVVNDTDLTVFINFGAVGVAASSTTSIPVKSGNTAFFEIGNAAKAVDAVVATGSATGKVYFTVGRGK